MMSSPRGGRGSRRAALGYALHGSTGASPSRTSAQKDVSLHGYPTIVRLLKVFDPHLAERDRAVIALEKNRAGLVDVCIQLASGGLVARNVVVHLFAIEYERDLVAHHRCLGRLPLVARS